MYQSDHGSIERGKTLASQSRSVTTGFGFTASQSSNPANHKAEFGILI